jgi:hypothetical protein
MHRSKDHACSSDRGSNRTKILARRMACTTLAAATLAACAPPDPPQETDAAPRTRAADDASCDAPAAVGTLPAVLADASGVAISRTHDGVLWIINNTEPDARVFATDTAGAVRGIVRVPSARNIDWEDIAIGPCDDGTDCLYVADIGDNFHERDDIGIYRFAEPPPRTGRSTAAEWFPIAYPEGPQDAEALFILHDGQLHIITKGRNRPVSLYRYPPPLRAGQTVRLELVQELSDGIVQLPDMVTGAGATPDGRFIVVRTYTELMLHRLDEGGRLAPAGPPLSLAGLDEAQGEGVDIRHDGVVFLTGERGLEPHRPAPLGRVACVLPGEG